MEILAGPRGKSTYYPDMNFSASATSPTSRVVTRQACDVCRLRKRKCSFGTGGGIHWTNTVLAPDPTTRCDNCEKSDSQCTFQMPSKARGPKRKTGYRYSIRTAHSASASPEVDASDTVNASSPLSPLPSSNPGSYALEERAPEPSIATTASPARCAPPYPTDVLLPRDLIHFILNDYLVHVYPLIPVIHRPSFKIDLDRNSDLHDESFLTLIISLCALTVCILPSRLRTYQDFSSPLPFRTRTEMVNHCHKFNQSFRDASYFDTVSHEKWASSFLIGIAFHQTGNTNQWRMLEVEAMQLLRLLEVHRISSYAGLDAIEVQLRKKAFWLMFYGYVHQMHNLRNERLMFLDTMLSCELNLEDLMPAPVDDEYISSSGLLPCPEDIAAASLTAGYNIHSRIFAAALRPPGSIGKQACICSHLKDPQQRLVSLRERLHRLKYMLDTVPPAYAIWSKKTTALTAPTSAATTPSVEGEEVGDIQREAIRVNIHVTHLWLQSMLLDQIDALESEVSASASATQASMNPPPLSSSSSPVESDTTFSDERESICQQLLHLLHSFSHYGLEPNGLSLVYKVRDVAVSLLAYPTEDPVVPRAQRAKEYLREFSSLLSMLDMSESFISLSLQSWTNISRQKHTVA